MQTHTDNILDQLIHHSTILIPSCGEVDENGLIMSRGLGAHLATLYPTLPRLFMEHLRKYAISNCTKEIYNYGYIIPSSTKLYSVQYGALQIRKRANDTLNPDLLEEACRLILSKVLNTPYYQRKDMSIHIPFPTTSSMKDNIISWATFHKYFKDSPNVHIWNMPSLITNPALSED